MTIIDELKNTIKYMVSLHEWLQVILSEACSNINNDTVQYVPDIAVQRSDIELKIDHAHHTLKKLFEEYGRNQNTIPLKSKSEIERLVEKLRECTQDTLSITGETIETIRKTRKKVIVQIRKLDNNKNAIQTYTKAQFL